MLTREAVIAILIALDTLLQSGYGLHRSDCYRISQRACDNEIRVAKYITCYALLEASFTT